MERQIFCLSQNLLILSYLKYLTRFTLNGIPVGRLAGKHYLPPSPFHRHFFPISHTFTLSSHTFIKNSFDNSSLNSAQIHPIDSTTNSTIVESQIIGRNELMNNQTNKVDFKADDERFNQCQDLLNEMEEYMSSEGRYRSAASMSIIEYIRRYGGLENGNRLEDVQVSLAGRITSKRSASTKLLFYDLVGDDAKVQIVADAKTSETGKYQFSDLHSSVKLDDFVAVTGFPGKSKRGELSIFSNSITVLSHGLNQTPTDGNTPIEKENHGMSSLSTSLRMVIVGDVHDEWEPLSDIKALEFLQPDVVLFTGDFGNENVELVRGVAAIDMPKAAILGNHDSWTTSKFSKKIKDGVQLQLDYLGEQHVGYSNLDFPALKLSVVGGRPFSCGGGQLFRKKLITARYGIRTMEESAEKIHKAAIATPKDHSLVFLAHNGPTGLGSNKDDICGRDWVSEGGDYGDPDLAQAISLTKETTNKRIPLVVFGHMHKKLTDGGFRKMMVIADNTMYLNAAIVPRVKSLSLGGSLRAFSVVEFSSGEITKVAETWVSITGDSASLAEEHLLFNGHGEQTQ
ncbi:hypothetical protein RND81_12G232600 [Saponaria officinalis]|uniref:lysine--tRNA ligase n=1 Tax=Saponaria officinalis TaxID=3572 RepID=A0AAW1HEJ7_SAPOF